LLDHHRHVVIVLGRGDDSVVGLDDHRKGWESSRGLDTQSFGIRCLLYLQGPRFPQNEKSGTV
jgi:hypothetical protein